MKVENPRAKKKVVGSFLNYAAKMHSPTVQASHKKRTKTQIAIIGSALVKASQDPKVLTSYTRECFAWAYYEGLRKGFSLGRSIASEDKENIPLQLLVKNPQQSTRRLCERLDELRIALPEAKYWWKKLKKDQKFAHAAEFWISALDSTMTKSAVEVYISLLRRQAWQIRMAGQWRTVLKKEKQLKKL